MAGQIYVEKLEPQQSLHDHPVVFIAGNGQTGTVGLLPATQVNGELTPAELVEHPRRP